MKTVGLAADAVQRVLQDLTEGAVSTGASAKLGDRPARVIAANTDGQTDSTYRLYIGCQRVRLSGA